MPCLELSQRPCNSVSAGLDLPNCHAIESTGTAEADWIRHPVRALLWQHNACILCERRPCMPACGAPRSHGQGSELYFIGLTMTNLQHSRLQTRTCLSAA